MKMQEAMESVDILGSAKDLDKFEGRVEDEVLEGYRRRRLEEMKAKSLKAKFGGFYDISIQDYVQEVTEGSRDATVICYLYKDQVSSCKKLGEILEVLARSHPETKFCRGISDRLVANYSDDNLPAILIYKFGTCQRQIVGTTIFGGAEAMTIKSVEWVLAKNCKAIDSDIDENPLKLPDREATRGSKGIIAQVRGSISRISGIKGLSSDSDE